MRVTYQEIKRSVIKSGECPVCGKLVRRSKTFSNTVNPFNRNDEGLVRTPAEVAECVVRLCNDWKPDFTHQKCKEGRS